MNELEEIMNEWPYTMTIEEMLTMLKEHESIEFNRTESCVEITYSLYKNGLLNIYRDTFPFDVKYGVDLEHDDWKRLIEEYSHKVHQRYHDKLVELANELKEVNNGDT